MEDETSNENGKTCFRIEVLLRQPLDKAKLRTLIFTILERLDINDSDVVSLSWGKTPQAPNIYDKFIVRLASRPGRQFV